MVFFMCGISFYCSTISHYEGELNDSLVKTQHRGPDARGVFFNKVGRAFIGLGHNRLSIIDLSESGKQPMSKSHVTVSFNGEIYNYLELREELIQLGYEFLSHSDTEVLLVAFLHYGVASFSRLRGMFAFVLLDEENNALYVVRDSIGIKPVYLFQNENALFGCSEIKGLKEFTDVDTAISKEDIFEFFNTGFLYEPSTGYKFIKKLMLGSYLKIDLNSNIRTVVNYSTSTDGSVTSSLKDMIADAVSKQEVADVPLGVFFSGGADSSILAKLSKKSNLLFAKYDEDPSSDADLKYSHLISQYLDKKLTIVDLKNSNTDKENILQSFDFVAKHSEELISDYTFWSTYLLSKAAKEQDYKVMLSGMGGDEAFAGYPRYLVLKNHKFIKLISPVLAYFHKVKIFPNSLDKKFERLVSYSKEKNWVIAYSRLLGYFSTQELTNIFPDFELLNQNYSLKLEQIGKSYKGRWGDKVKLGQHFDLTGFLAHNLAVSDKASMLASIELRVPLLDEHVVAHGLSLKSNKLVSGNNLKQPLRFLLQSLIPKKFVDRPKTGFNPPLDSLILKLGEEAIILELQSLYEQFPESELRAIVRKHFSGRENNTYKLWQLLYFSYWLKNNSPA